MPYVKHFFLPINLTLKENTIILSYSRPYYF